MTLYRSLILVAALLASSVTFAQTPAATVSGTACAKLEPHPGRLSSDNQRKQWNKELQSWQECMKKYVTEAQSRADKAVKEANAAVAESNAAVNEYNAAVKDVQAQIDATTK